MIIWSWSSWGWDHSRSPRGDLVSARMPALIETQQLDEGRRVILRAADGPDGRVYEIRLSIEETRNLHRHMLDCYGASHL